MTTLDHDSTTFAARALTGFLAANPSVRAVDGGVARRDALPAGQVAVVTGGGSGHYPAFAGLVGPGLATGAAYGNIFASPSAGQIRRVARATEVGGGVVLAFGNYAGDVLNFGQAAERLRGEGIDVRVIEVTDDVASADASEAAKRRGVAGDLVVFKVLGASAERGDDLDAVEEYGRRANAATFSFGVAFSGCTLPGAAEPLFDVPAGLMSVGLGIHGEPGISEQALPTADELAALLADRLLAERPASAPARCVALLNGLGTFKYEELFVVYGLVAERLAAAGVEVVLPEVGELVTSLDMSGVSLTLAWLDDDLLELWGAPAFSPAFRTGGLGAGIGAQEQVADPATHAASPASPEAHVDTRHSAAVPAAVALLGRTRDMILAAEKEFGRIDAIAGDGDHGIGMARGITAAVAAAHDSAERGSGLGALLADAGEGWAENAGGTSGALWGVALTAVGASLADESDPAITGASARAARAALDAIQRLGKAEVGDKTLVDAFAPLVLSLEAAADAGDDVVDAWSRAAAASADAAAATAQLRPLRGRARPLAEKSLGHPDAGAVSLSRVAGVIADGLPALTATPAHQ
ncbi:dihydroxyacetone kinase family protein [Frondihabitans australicus]|uniref:Homodimeric dihydroxyacetone kinase n=1 Tax=Frondihabitans australicus TaxID=386892 RepID=A0A495IMZ6_9MICO|nr:dihydroxyacetone kinase family protein [Frondihabitans australicus]RKR76546.1 homodimeric dihydroxyacetone kinase [Frondihabitans australicus]